MKMTDLSNKFLLLKSNFQLISKIGKLPPTFGHNCEFSKQLALDMIPRSANKKFTILARKNEIERQRNIEKSIRFIDGTSVMLPRKPLQRQSLQPKQEEKLEMQANIRKSRTTERILSELLNVFSSGAISDPLLKRPIWRISRLVPGPDLRRYIAYWVIDDEQYLAKYKVQKQISSLVV